MNEGLRLGVKSVKFNWRGEPLIYKNIWPILNFALKHFIVEMNTNLSVNLNDEQIETVSKIHSLRVSMDSVTNYAEARKGGKMHLVFSNIARILEHRDIIEINRTESNITESLPEFVEAFHKELYRAAGKMTECSRIKIRSVPARRRNSSGVFNDDLRKVRKYCGQPSRRLLVSASGNIYPCCVPYHEPKNFIVGSDSLEKAWDSKKRKELVKDLRKMKFNYNVCKNCPSSDAWK